MRAILLAVSMLALTGALLAVGAALATPDRWRVVAPHRSAFMVAWTLAIAIGVPILLGTSPRAAWGAAALVVGAALGWIDTDRRGYRIADGALLTGGARSTGLLFAAGSVALSAGIVTEVSWLLTAGLLTIWSAAAFTAAQWLHDRQLVRRQPARLEPPAPLHCTRCGAQLITPDRCGACGFVPSQHCSWCGATHPPGVVVCAACGGALVPPPLPGRGLSLCLRCGADLDSAVRHCWRCGEHAPPTCPGCGLPILAGDDYCHSCDLPLVWS